MQRGGLSRNAVSKGLAELENFGWIKRRHVKKGGVNHYDFYYPGLLDPESGHEVGDLVRPTKEEAKDWAAVRRQKNKNKF